MKTVNLLLAACLLIVLAARSPEYKVGDTVKDFSLKNVDGKMVSLSDYKNSKGVVVIFDCNTCPFSKGYNDRIKELSKTSKAKGFPLVAINANDPGISPGDSFDEMVAYAKNKGYDFPYLVDATQNVARDFGATNTPHVFLLKKEGDSFKVAYVGAIDNNARDEKAVTKRYVESAIDAIIANKPVPEEKTKAIGCSIKFRNT